MYDADIGTDNWVNFFVNTLCKNSRDISNFPPPSVNQMPRQHSTKTRYLVLLIAFACLVTIACTVAVICNHNSNLEPFFISNGVPDKQNLYVIRAHQDNGQFFDLWNKMNNELESNSVWILFDITKNPGFLDTSFYQDNMSRIIVHTEDDCKAINPLHNTMWHTVESSLVITWRAVAKAVYFDHLWWIESDVYCDGSLARTLQKASHLPHDLLISYMEYYGERGNENWAWWNSLVGEASNVPIEQRMKSYLPISRYTPKMFQRLEENLGRASGFCECYIPTLARSSGLSFVRCPDEMIGDLDTQANSKFKLTRSNLPSEKNDKLWHKYHFE